MSDPGEAITSKIKKILELARRGQENERLVAIERLNRLLKKHKLTLDDIDPETKSLHEFRYKTALEKNLLFQVKYLVTDEASGYWQTRGKNEVSFDITKAQAIEIDRLYSFWRVELKNELDLFFNAFIQKNRIFGNATVENDEEITPEELARIKRMALMMQAMEAKSPLQQLGAS